MLQGAVFLSIVALTVGSPLLGEFQPHPGCHYNITPQANLKVENADFTWFFDSVTSATPLTGVTCLNWNGKFTVVNGVGFLQFIQRVVAGSYEEAIGWAGPNYANAPADFALDGKDSDSGTPLTAQFRIADTDSKSYALIIVCKSKVNGPFEEGMLIVGPKRTGVDPAVRQRLVDRLVEAGWNPQLFQRVPSQSGC